MTKLPDDKLAALRRVRFEMSELRNTFEKEALELNALGKSDALYFEGTADAYAHVVVYLSQLIAAEES